MRLLSISVRGGGPGVHLDWIAKNGYDWDVQAGFTDKEEPIYTIGRRGHLVDRIVSVDELMDELIGFNHG